MCRIQLRLGEEFLSDICVTYPRVANLVNNVLEKSATMSCPEAARLALLNPDEMEFDELTEPVETRNIIDKQIDTHGLAVAKRARSTSRNCASSPSRCANRNYSLASV